MEAYLHNKEYLRHAIAVLELMSAKGTKRTAIFSAAGEYWLIIRKDFIARGICRPIGNDGRDVAPDKMEMIEPTLAHYRYALSELEKADKDHRLDVRIKKSGAWAGWLAIIISAVSLSVSLCSRDQGPTETLRENGTSSVPDTHTFQDSPDSPVPNIRETQNKHTVSDRKTTDIGDNAISSKSQ